MGVVLANDQHLLDLSSNDWMVRTDSGWAGSSHGYITKFKEDRRITEFIYQFKATKLWPWPEIDFFTSLVKSVDFSKFKVVQLDIQGESGKEIYFYFIVEDRNLRNPKPLMSRFLLTGEKQKIYLSFSDFKISSDWQPRNPGYNQSIEWNKVKSFGLHVKGRDNEWGRIKLFEVKLLENNLVGSVNLAQVRSNPPRYYLFDL